MQSRSDSHANLGNAILNTERVRLIEEAGFLLGSKWNKIHCSANDLLTKLNFYEFPCDVLQCNESNYVFKFSAELKIRVNQVKNGESRFRNVNQKMPNGESKIN